MRSLRNLFLVQMDKEDQFEAFTFSLSSSAAKSLAISALSSKFSMSMSSSAMLFVPLFPRMGAGASFFPELPHLSQTYFCCHLLGMQTFEFLAVLFFTPICILELFFCSLTKSFLPHAKDCVTCKLNQNTCFCCMKNILLLAPVCLRRQWKSAVGGQPVVALQCSLCLQRPNLGRCFLLQLAQMKASRTSESADSARSRLLYLFAHCISICCSPASMTALYVPSAAAASSKAWLMLPDLRSLRFADVL